MRRSSGWYGHTPASWTAPVLWRFRVGRTYRVRFAQAARTLDKAAQRHRSPKPGGREECLLSCPPHAWARRNLGLDHLSVICLIAPELFDEIQDAHTSQPALSLARTPRRAPRRGGRQRL